MKKGKKERCGEDGSSFLGFQSVTPHGKLVWGFSFFFIQDWNSLDISSAKLYLAISAWINCVIRKIWIQITRHDGDVAFTHVYVLVLLLIEFYTLDQQLIGNNCCFERNLRGTVCLCYASIYFIQVPSQKKAKCCLLNDGWLQQLCFTGSTVMQTKSPFSCWDRSPSDANVTGPSNRRMFAAFAANPGL